MSQVWKHVINEYPRFTAALSSPSDSRPTTLSTTDLGTIIDAGEQLFPLDSRRAQAQLWFYSFLGTVLGPTGVAIVEFEQVPRLVLADAVLNLHSDNYWLSWECETCSDYSSEAVRAAGADFHASCVPIVSGLAAVADIRPAPLWALAVDGLRQSALEAGNAAYDPAMGVSVANDLVAGFLEAHACRTDPSVVAPTMEYMVVEDGEFLSLEAAGLSEPVEISEDAVVFAPRSSCCMIYRLERADICTSCPRQDDDRRKVALLQHATSLRG